MRIQSIQLRNGYKRFNDLTINLGQNPKKIIALVGPNGSGKSSVFDGMLFLNSQYGTIGSTGTRGMNFHSMSGNRLDQRDILINFSNGENFDTARRRREVNNSQNTIFSFRNSYRYNSDLNIKALATIPDIKLNQTGASSSVDLDNRMVENYQRLYVYMTNYRKDNNLTDIQTNEAVIGELNRILFTCLDLTISDHGDIIGGRGSLYFTKLNQPKEFPFDVLSSGEKEVVDILLDTYLKRGEYNESIYLIDEPELHLNTAIQKKLLIEIEKLLPDTCQLWIATHSIGFLNALQKDLNDKSDVIDFNGDFSSAPAQLSLMKKNRKNWQRLFTTALEDLTGLIAPETIIYCEGRKEPSSCGDEQGLDAEVYNQIFSEEFPNTLFVSSGGSTEPDEYAAIALPVLNKAFKSVQLLLLKDKDVNPDGSITTNDQRVQFIELNSRHHRMLKRREVEDYVFDFEILQRAKPDIDKALYDLLIPDIYADVKGAAGDLMRLCNINERGVNKEKFKVHLAQYVTADTAIYNELKDAIFS